jgi:hypothetical protein
VSENEELAETELWEGGTADAGSVLLPGAAVSEAPSIEGGDVVVGMYVVSTKTEEPADVAPSSDEGEVVPALPVVSAAAAVLEVPSEEGGDVVLGMYVLSAGVLLASRVSSRDGDDVVVGLVVASSIEVAEGFSCSNMRWINSFNSWISASAHCAIIPKNAPEAEAEKGRFNSNNGEMTAIIRAQLSLDTTEPLANIRNPSNSVVAICSNACIPGTAKLNFAVEFGPKISVKFKSNMGLKSWWLS